MRDTSELPKYHLPIWADDLKNPETRQRALYAIGTWVADTCWLFGASPETAFRVAAEFIAGIEKGYDRPR